MLIVWKKIKAINNLLILNFSLSNHFVANQKFGLEMNFGSNYVIKWVDSRPKNRLWLT